MSTKPTRMLRLTLLAAIALVSPHAAAQSYPVKPVRLVIPYPPGGAGDAIARAIGHRMSTALGQPVVYDNRPGGSQIIAVTNVAASPADGYSVLMASGTSLVLNPILKKGLPYLPERDLTLVSKWASAPNFLLATTTIPAKSVTELIALARSRPGGLNYGSIGVGSNLHIAGEMFAHAVGIQLTHIPYKGTSPALTDLVSGQIHLLFDPGTAGLALARDGRLRLLAVTSRQRVSIHPETPTMAEAGVPGYEIDSWWGLAAPAKTPREVIERLAAAVASATKDATLRDAFVKDAIQFESSTPAEFGRFVQAETTKWRSLLQTLKIEAE